MIFKEGLISIRKRPPYLRYEVVSRLSELKPILANIWESFRREEEESHQQGRIDVAVAREREKWAQTVGRREKKAAADWLFGRVRCDRGREYCAQ